MSPLYRACCEELDDENLSRKAPRADGPDNVPEDGNWLRLHHTTSCEGLPVPRCQAVYLEKISVKHDMLGL